MPKSSSIPTSKVKRSSIAGIAAAKIGVKHLGYKTRSLLMDESEKKKSKELHEENLGLLIFSVLSQLKGTALKVSQLLSMEADILPLSIREQLKNAYYQVQPINRALVRKQIIQELGKKPQDIFKCFEPKAFAAASIGQVHRGESFAGQPLAIKIQYPGIASTIESDLKIVEQLFWTLSKTSEILPHKKVLDLMMCEMKNRLGEEVDYEIEAKNLHWFLDQVKLKGIIIPKPIDELSSKRVLTLEMLDGLHLQEWLSTQPDQTEKNRIGQLLFDFFWYSVFKLKKINADPHPGNFLFLQDGNLGVLDFGCVRSLDDKFIQQFSILIPEIVNVFYRNAESKTLRKTYQSLKILSDDVSQDEFEKQVVPHIRRFACWFGEAYATETFDFNKKSPCPGRPDNEGIKAVKLVNGMFQEQMCFDRAHLGLMNLLTEIGATIKTDWKKFYV